MLDLDSELELYFSGLGKVKFEFMGDSDIEASGSASLHTFSGKRHNRAKNKSNGLGTVFKRGKS